MVLFTQTVKCTDKETDFQYEVLPPVINWFPLSSSLDYHPDLPRVFPNSHINQDSQVLLQEFIELDVKPSKETSSLQPEEVSPSSTSYETTTDVTIPNDIHESIIIIPQADKTIKNERPKELNSGVKISDITKVSLVSTILTSTSSNIPDTKPPSVYKNKQKIYPSTSNYKLPNNNKVKQVYKKIKEKPYNVKLQAEVSEHKEYNINTK